MFLAVCVCVCMQQCMATCSVVCMNLQNTFIHQVITQLKVNQPTENYSLKQRVLKQVSSFGKLLIKKEDIKMIKLTVKVHKFLRNKIRKDRYFL